MATRVRTCADRVHRSHHVPCGATDGGRTDPQLPSYACRSRLKPSHRGFVWVSHMKTATTGAYRVRLWIGIVLLAVGLSGHLFTAAVTGGQSLHYRHHILGFVFLSAVAWVILALLGRRFWRGRHDITVLTLGAVQAILGLMVYASSRG